MEGKRKTYLYELNRVALLRYLKDQAGDVVEIMSGSCSAQVPLMCGRTKRNELRESREKGLDLDLPSSTVQGASSPLKSKSSPVASDLDSKPETGADQSCLDNPDSMFTRAVSGLEAAIGSTLSPGVRHKLLAALQGFCGRLCLCHSLPHADRITRVLPVCRKVADEAVSILRGSEDWPSPDSLVVRYVEAIHTARKALMDEIIEAALPTESAHAKEG